MMAVEREQKCVPIFITQITSVQKPAENVAGILSDR